MAMQLDGGAQLTYPEIASTDRVPIIDVSAGEQGSKWMTAADFQLYTGQNAAVLRLDSFDVKHWGAVGDGIADDTAAIQATVNHIQNTVGGGFCYLSGFGIYKIRDTIHIPPGFNPISPTSGLPTPGHGGGVSIRGDGPWVSRIDATDPLMWNKPAIFAGDVTGSSWSASAIFRDFGITGPSAQSGFATNSFNLGTHPDQAPVCLCLFGMAYSLVENVDIWGGGVGLVVSASDGVLLNKVHAREARQTNCWLVGPMLSVTLLNSLFQVANSAGVAAAIEEVANIKITNNSDDPTYGANNKVQNVLIDGCLLDEIGLGFVAGGQCLYARNVDGLTLHRALVYAPGNTAFGLGGPYYGINIGQFATGVKLDDVQVKPYNVDVGRVSSGTIFIHAGARGTKLVDVTTDYNAASGGLVDIIDNAPDTMWRNVNGVYKHSQTVVYAAAVTPDIKSGPDFFVNQLTGNITVNAPTMAGGTAPKGARISFYFLQDGVGGRTVTWNAAFNNSWSNAGNAAGTRSAVTFVFNGVIWVQDGAQRTWA